MAKHSTAARLIQVDEPNNDNDVDRQPRQFITPSGQRTFIVRDGTDPGSRKRKPLSRARKQWPPGKITSVCTLYLTAIERLIRGRHGGPCDTDDGEAYYLRAVELKVMRFVAMEDDDRNPKPVDSYGWATKHTPFLTLSRPRAWFEAQERRILEGLGAKPAVVPSADEMADDLQITHAEVLAFRLRGVGAIDRRAPQRKAEAKRAEAEQKRAKRKADEAVIPHAESMAQTKPWEALDMSRATYYRKVEAGELPRHPSMRRLRPKRRT